MGPLNDIAMEKLVREMPDEYEAAGQFLLTFGELKSLPQPSPPSRQLSLNAEMVPRSGTDSSSTVIKLDTVRRIAEKVSNSRSCRPCSLVPPPLTLRSSSLPGQAPPAGHHALCSGEAELHPVPPHGSVLGPPQP